MAQRIYQDIINQAFPLEMEIRQALQKEKACKKQDECEIIVVDSTDITARGCGGFGKIYVTNTLLDYYRKHEEMIATIFGHQVGDDLARHDEETVSKFIF